MPVIASPAAALPAAASSTAAMPAPVVSNTHGDRLLGPRVHGAGAGAARNGVRPAAGNGWPASLRPRRPSRAWLAALAAVFTAACAITDPPPPAAPPLPAQWTESGTVDPNAAPVDAAWWRHFRSAQLTALIDEALSANTDLRIAAERVRQADLALAIANVARAPIVTGSAGTSASRAKADGEDAVRRETTSLGLTASYEIDLWGRIAAAVRASQASLAATRFDAQTVRLTVAANVANTYFQWLAARERLQIAHDNLATAERVLGVVEAKRRHGVATALEVSQQRTTVLSQRTALIPLELQQRQAASALALLLGRLPQDATLQEETFADLTIPLVEPGLPSTLLYRRPDLAAAEAALAGASANVAAARAALLPSFGLSITGGASSAQLLSLAHPASTLSAGLSLAQTLFDSGRLRRQVDLSLSQREVLVTTYEAAVRSALKEVDDSLGNIDRSHRQTLAQRAVIDQARESLRLAELRYREGAGDLLAVLDAQRVLFTAQDSLSTLRLSHLAATVDLYRALGGGWSAG